MKKPIDFLILLAPALLWLLSSVLLGDDFALPNRLMLAILCTAAGAGALVTNRKVPGFFALVAGVGMLAAVPVEHEMPVADLTTLGMSNPPTAHPIPQLRTAENQQLTATDLANIGTALLDSGHTQTPVHLSLIVSAADAAHHLHHEVANQIALPPIPAADRPEAPGTTLPNPSAAPHQQPHANSRVNS